MAKGVMAEWFAQALRQLSEFSGRSGGGYKEKPYVLSWPLAARWIRDGQADDFGGQV